MATDLNDLDAERYTASDIQVLGGMEAVRRRPGMYIGSTDQQGLHHLIYEIVDNSVDEFMAGSCSRVEIRILEDGTVHIEDDGRGIPVDIHPTTGNSAVETVMTTLHAGAKFGGKAYTVSGGAARCRRLCSQRPFFQVQGRGLPRRQGLQPGVLSRGAPDRPGFTAGGRVTQWQDGHSRLLHARPGDIPRHKLRLWRALPAFQGDGLS